MKADWKFPESNGGITSGFNDAGIENFTGERFKNLGREIIQNSLDAVQLEIKKPVIVHFKRIAVTRESFPGISSLQKSMKSCLNIADSQEDKKAENFFRKAVEELQKDKIEFLRIDDFNTTGLTFDHKKPKVNPFYAITKGRGTSRKQSDTAAGSYGIGQNAPFAVSNLRTVLYSTYYLDRSGNSQEIFQGKSILISHTIHNDETQGTGFYGDINGLKPLFNTDIPALFRRSSFLDGDNFQGTSVFIAGFASQPHWQYELAASVIINFFLAIDEQKLIVNIDDKIKISSETLQYLFTEPKLLEILKGDIAAEFNDARAYYNAYKTADVKESELPNLGHCKLWISIENGDDEEQLHTRRAALIRRNGMLITDNQKGLQRFFGVKSFTAVFKCESDRGNRSLREMEPPRHDCFEPGRAPDPRKASKYLNELRGFIRDEINKIAAPDEGEVSELNELAEFLPNPDSEDPIPGSKVEGERNPEGKQIITLKPLKRVMVQQPDTLGSAESRGEEEGSLEEIDDSTTLIPNPDPNPNPNPNPMPNPNPNPELDNRNCGKGRYGFEISNVRVISFLDNLYRKEIFFTPMRSGLINLKLQIAGDSEFENLSIKGAENGYKISDGKITNLEVYEGIRLSIKVILSTPHEGSIKVIADEI